jgi:hypothetical protein
MKDRAQSGDYVRLNQVRQLRGTNARYRFAVLGEPEECNGQLGWAAALVELGDREGRSSCTTVWLAPRSFRVV